MSVGRLCVRDVGLADRDEPVWQAADRMNQRSVRTLMVLNELREPIGVITDRDLTVRVLAARRDPNAVSVGEVMTSDPETIAEDASIALALALMHSGRFRRLPVVDREGKLVGVLSLDDVLMLVAEELAQVGELLKREAPRRAEGESPA